MTDSLDTINTVNTPWCCVTKKPRNESKSNSLKKPELSFFELSEIIVSCLIPYKKEIIASYIYGSRARETNHPDSDADIILFWKVIPDLNTLYEIRETIEKALGFKIDLVSFMRTAKNIHHYNLCDIAYFENVANDARQIMGISTAILFLFESSYKMSQLSRK